MSVAEWENFYNVLRVELKENYPELYPNLFKDEEDPSKLLLWRDDQNSSIHFNNSSPFFLDLNF